MENVLVVHGGGPTAVINSSLYGIIEEAKESGRIDKVYGAIGGSEAIFQERFLDLMQFPEEKLKLLLETPATAIGSSRYALEKEDYEAMVGIFKKHDIKYVLLNGGNGTMDTCGKIYEVCKNEGICVVGVPKTVDNDIAITDHTPGFGSAARYIAATTEEVGADIKSLPIHVCVIEAMGRNAGWITAASVLARKKPGDAPHLVYLPERAFNEEEFLEDVKRLYDQLGGVVVVASEGLRGADGEPIVPPIFKSGRATYYGDVSAYLANLVIQKLGIKARSEKPGICGRSSIAWQSPVDRDEAVLAGRKALQAALNGESGVMAGFIRDETEDGSYKIHVRMIPISEVMLYEKVLPEEYINERGNDVTEEFAKWCRPLIGPELRDFIDFQEYMDKK
ncbi:diphosphate--fructose-6-phosphate 1-phosphotransferase [Clostridium sp. MCC353]|uniref:diphosphate--fructose-6-phosphate 1-phosphotransferase n=1 Tax=Clostridium sp. MCC353 TaxID=2592646 RepID=UPI001C00EC09|nr:diphosphate--fructose-6-phosphate 1-phosphotransferase [Clostridium sp. MCC353]MBT9775970.1 diphosphate--fructose-6-phosphate 1-phosphotransferase [Clostridium sp. MCC353]